MKIYLFLHKEPSTPRSCLASVGDGQSRECCGGVGRRTTVPCLPRSKKPTMCILAIKLFSWMYFSCVFAAPLVACGRSNSMKKNSCSVESRVSSTSKVLLSKIFLGSQNQLSFLHTYATLPLIKYYARQIVFRNLYNFIVFILCSACTSSITLLSSDLHIHWNTINNSAMLTSKIPLFHSCIHFSEEEILLSKMAAYVGSWFSEESLMECSSNSRHWITSRSELASKYTCIHEIQSFFFSEDLADEFLVEFFYVLNTFDDTIIILKQPRHCRCYRIRLSTRAKDHHTNAWPWFFRIYLFCCVVLSIRLFREI